MSEPSELVPVVTDDDEFVRCAEKQTVHEQSLPHRTVWGMVYSPAQRVWLVQWRRPDKEICPNLWDMSCGGHVGCVDGGPEPVWGAYVRELAEELGLEAERAASLGPAVLVPGHAPTVALGPAREYHLYPARGGRELLVKEQVAQYFSLYDGPVTLGPDTEPQAVAWLSADQIMHELIEPGRATQALASMLARCTAVLRLAGMV